ncbi:MAG: hypothetical protein V3T77_01215, partial [Planctomycetota bacterium]
MSKNARPGLTIPGYQPVEKLGNAPSFGVWLRARQTRMDRRVLLKLLPPGDTLTQTLFTREINLLVRLDGDGVLRVISEGSEAGVRYLVLDEAGSVPLKEAKPATPLQFQELAATLEKLYRRVGEEGWVLLPIPPQAMRCFPAGHFGSADLGWVVPIGEQVPNHRAVPQDCRGLPAARWMAAPFLAATLQALGEHLECRWPPGVRRAIPTLEAVRAADHEAEQDPLATPYFAGDREPVRRIPAGVLVFLALILVAGVGWGTQFFLGGDDDGVEPPPPPETVMETDGPPPKQPSEQSPVSDFDVVDPEEEALLSLAEILGRENLRGFRPLKMAQRRALKALVKESTDTPAAAWSQALLRWDQVHKELAHWMLWGPRRGEILNEIASGRTLKADVQLRKAEQQLAALSEGEMAPELARLQRVIQEKGQKKHDELVMAVQALQEKRDYTQAMQKIDAALAGLTLHDQQWAEQLRDTVNQEAELYRGGEQSWQAAWNHALELTRGGKWQAAIQTLQNSLPPEQFPDLFARAQTWRSWLDRAANAANQLREGLQGSREKKSHRYSTVSEEDLVRGKVEEIYGAAFLLKVDGRTQHRKIRFPELKLVTLEELAPGVSIEEWWLMVFFLGEYQRALDAGAR